MGTKLWTRLNNEGRILNLSPGDEPADDSYGGTIRSNIIPKLMTRVELLSGYRDLLKQVRDWRKFEARLKGMVEMVAREDTLGRRRLPWNQGGRQSGKAPGAPARALRNEGRSAADPHPTTGVR